MLRLCVRLSPILSHIFCTAHRCLAASKYISCSFLLVILGPILLYKSPLFRRTNPLLSVICSTLLCLYIVGWGPTDSGHARLFGTIVSWLCYYILHLWGVHLHLCGLSPVVCTYHLLLLLQHKETTWPVCLRSMSEAASHFYHVVELYQSILCHPFAVVDSFLCSTGIVKFLSRE